LLNLFNPFGTLGILGYSQYDFLSFSQLASITGMWGLTFMVTWFGSVVYWLLENIENKKNIQKGFIIYFTILISILVFGSIRLNIPLGNSTVKIAGIHTHDKRVEGAKMNDYLADKDTVAFKRVSNTIIQSLIRETIKQSDAGAKIVVWSEICTKILKQDEDSLKTVFKNLAKERQIYLLTSPYTIVPNSPLAFLPSAPEKLVNPNAAPNTNPKPENKALLFSPSGNLILTHYKYGGNFMEGTVQGDKVIKSVPTEYGKLSAIICWDGDYPSIVKQVGKLGIDILFLPASDWEEIDPAHAIVTIFRGIENGCSVVRQTRNGLSIMTDPRGKIITQMDHFKNNSWVNVGQVPTKKWFTLYPIIGDLFGWLSFIGLLYFILKPVTKKSIKLR
jgi:apolipoprotein N-acyltransferase